jgi:hypothetical protein
MKTVHLLIPFALVACSSSSTKSGSPPVIDSITMPGTAMVGSDGYYTLAGSITFHDADDAVTKLKIVVPSAGNATFEYDVPGGQTSYALIVKVSGAAPKGPIEYDVSLIDAGGAESAASKQTVTLQ